MASTKIKAKDRMRYPGVEKAIKRSIQHLIVRDSINNGYMNNYQATADEIFNWWVSNTSAKEFFGMLRFQRTIDFNDI